MTILDQLKSLTPAQFDQLTHELGVPPAYLPRPASQVELATTVLRYLDQQSHGQQRLHEVLRRLEPSKPSIDPENNPYLGLDFFHAEDQHRFFGRDAVADELLRLARQHRFVALIGASGSGKSSLLHAGLVPRVFKAGENTARIGVTPVVFRPRGNPFAEFAHAYLSLKEPDLNDEDRMARSKKLTKQLDPENSELAIIDLVKLLLEQRHTQEILLIADQFEELYTLNSPTTQRNLVSALTALLDPTLPCRLLLSYRADFTSEAIDSFGDLLNQHGKLFLERMNAEELREAIEKPAQQQGMMFEAELATRMIRDVGQEPGYLPLLQFALHRLWGEREGTLLTHRGYERIGGVQRALDDYANGVLARFTDEEQTRIRRIFLQLVRPGSRSGEADTRQVATREQIADWPLVMALADVRLVVTGQRDGQDTVEVAHEALIQHWQTLRDWINEDRLALRLLADVRHQAREWDAAERAESHLPRWNAKLEQAEELLGNPRFGAMGLELAFLAACRALKEKEAREEAEKQRKLRQRLVWAAVVSMLAVLAAGLSFYLFVDAQEKEQAALNAEALAKTQEQKALAEKQRADAQKNQALRTQSLFLADLSTQYSNKGLPATAMRLALEALPGSSQEHPQRPFVPQAQQALYDALVTQRQGIIEHDDKVNGAVFNPDGKTFLTVSGNTVLLWDLQGNSLAVLKGHIDTVTSAVFSPDGKTLLTASEDNTARLWDLQGNSLAVLKGHTRYVNSAIFSPDGKTLLTASGDYTAQLWDLQGNRLAVFNEHTSHVTSAVFSPDGKTLLTASADNTARLWDLQGNDLAILKGHTSWVTSVVFSPDGKTLLTMSGIFGDNTARLWDLQGNRLAVLKGHTNNVNSALFSPDGTTLLTASADNTARLRDLQGNSLAVLEGHTSNVNSALFSPDGTTLLTASGDNTARLWDLQGDSLVVLKGHTDSVTSAVFSLDSKTLLTASKDKTARLWNSQGNSPTMLKGHISSVYSAIFSPDGKTLLTASNDNTARLWDLQGNSLAVLKGHTNELQSAVFSPDGKTLLTASEDNTARLWDLQGNNLAVFKGHKSYVGNAVFSPDGKTLLTVSTDNTARLWDLQGNSLAVLKGHTNAVNSAVFSPGGKTLLTASTDNTARLWDLKGNRLVVLKGHTERVERAVFNPDGKSLLTASKDNTARLWDLQGNHLAVLEGHTGSVGSAVFSPDGKTLLTASGDNTARLWGLRGNSLAVFKGHTEWVQSAVFNPDGKILLTASGDNTARLWDLRGNSLAVLKGHTEVVERMELSMVYSAVFSPDGKTVLTASYDNTARLWPAFHDLPDLIRQARATLARPNFTCAEREKFFLSPCEADGQ